ncbi:MAG: orotidine-5'-phosphate decarboxylase [Candidatus Eremiobacteraeota bacterium]|nr:orotidine-5'-phosphate decarboxylase [Candidatus Eremiobacteraeota bacterium]MBV8366495.1 orotidine-5'-phosphate decarboxylase [Candidatus Eremiobacteraeota bacterium]
MTELIVALDEPTFERASAIVDKTCAVANWYKVGYQAFYAYGERIIEALRARGSHVFLDLKLLDIPNTVYAGVQSLARYKPDMLTVHASGGGDMLAAAARARDESKSAGGSMRLLAVTVLTSLSKEELVLAGEDLDPHELVAVRAELAARNRIDGVVCAVDEVSLVMARAADSLLTVCPGIRPAGKTADDQRRVATPMEAAIAGADFIVVGRPITAAADPAAAAAAIQAELRAIKPLPAI